MKLSVIVDRIKEAKTEFGNYVGGSAELDLAIRNTLVRETAFVVPVIEDAAANKLDGGISQIITEKFGVIVALKNDNSDKDKMGLAAYDRLHDIRSQIFKSVVGWLIRGAESFIEYAGGRFLVIRNSYLWWEFDFQYKSIIIDFDGYCDISEQSAFFERLQKSQMDSFDKISTKYILWPSPNLPWKGEYVSDIDSDMTDMETWIDLTDDPNAGGFGRGFGSGFDFYKILNRINDPK